MIVDYMYVSLRVEVSLFVLGPEIEKPRRSRGRQLGEAQKKNGRELIYFFFAAVTFTNCYGIVNICVGKKTKK
jgi:hypothetical protein